MQVGLRDDDVSARVKLRVAAEKWWCSPSHVARLIRTGQLRGMRLGVRAWRTSLDAIAEFEQAKIKKIADAIGDPTGEKAARSIALQVAKMRRVFKGRKVVARP